MPLAGVVPRNLVKQVTAHMANLSFTGSSCPAVGTFIISKGERPPTILVSLQALPLPEKLEQKYSITKTENLLTLFRPRREFR